MEHSCKSHPSPATPSTSQPPSSPDLEEILSGLNGDPERFRPILLDKDQLLRNMCDYAKKRAKRRRLPVWAVIGEITGHGSGVSSAIYELYRRRD